jgi:hypothetical protein
MLKFGIYTQNQYLKAGVGRRCSGSRVSYSLLEIGENPTKEQTQIFEDICFTLRTSNGTYRTTFRHRFQDVDVATLDILRRFFPCETELLVEDRAVSHGLTSVEWAQKLFPIFPNAQFEASDKLLYLVQLFLGSNGTYIFEPEGRPLQYIKPPFVVGLCYIESLPVNRLIVAYAKRCLQRSQLPIDWMTSAGGDGYQVSKIRCIHPEAWSYSKSNPRFQLRTRSVFDITPKPVHALRTMNILNKAYFSDSQLSEGADAAFQSLRQGGVWVVGRTLESDFSNHVSFLQRQERGWEVLSRIGNGSEMEAFVNRTHLIDGALSPRGEKRQRDKVKPSIDSER